MEDSYGNSSSRVLKLKALSGNVSPINSQRDNHQFFIGGGRFHHPSKSPTSIFDPYAAVDKSNLENFDSTLIRYLRSGSPASPAAGDPFQTVAVYSPKYHQMIGGSSGYGSRGSSLVSPLSAVDNFETPPSRSPPVFNTPLKVEEDVLVMDGILVGSVPAGRVRSSASSDSSGSSSSGSNSFYKTEICRSWEDSRHCRYGSKCQFAHGKEEVRPSRFLNKNKSEAQTCKSHTSSGGSCSYGAKCRFVQQQDMGAASATEPAVTTVAVAKTKTPPPIKQENSSDSSSSKNSRNSRSSSSCSTTTVSTTDWSPLDDGIVVALPASASTDKNPSRQTVDAYIHGALHGPSRGKRLPVFAEICPE